MGAGALHGGAGGPVRARPVQANGRHRPGADAGDCHPLKLGTGDNWNTARSRLRGNQAGQLPEVRRSERALLGTGGVCGTLLGEKSPRPGKDSLGRIRQIAVSPMGRHCD